MSHAQTGPARDFLEEMVKPTIDEFRRESSDRRRGFAAAIFLNQLVDYIWEYRPSLRAKYPGGLKDYRKHLGQQSFAVGVIRDVADATKHARITRPTARLNAPGAVAQEPGVFDLSVFDEGAFDTEYLSVTLSDGTVLPFGEEIEKALTYLEAEANRP